MVLYSKLGLTTSEEIKEVKFNEETIKVKQYLPVDKKLELLGTTISMSADANRFYNVGTLNVLLTVNILHYYTDIDFTEEDQNNVTKTYDEVISNDLVGMVFDAIPEAELNWLQSTMMDTVESIYKYQNSVLGLMEQMTAKYTDLGDKAEGIQKALQDPENLKLVKDILTKLG